MSYKIFMAVKINMFVLWVEAEWL